MRINELHGDAAVDALADVIEPCARIGKDPAIRAMLTKGTRPDLSDIASLIKAHKKDVLLIMAAFNGESYDAYAKRVTVLSLPVELMQLFNDPYVQQLFGYVVQNVGASQSTSAAGSIAESAL